MFGSRKGKALLWIPVQHKDGQVYNCAFSGSDIDSLLWILIYLLIFLSNRVLVTSILQHMNRGFECSSSYKCFLLIFFPLNIFLLCFCYFWCIRYFIIIHLSPLYHSISSLFVCFVIRDSYCVSCSSYWFDLCSSGLVWLPFLWSILPISSLNQFYLFQELVLVLQLFFSYYAL